MKLLRLIPRKVVNRKGFPEDNRDTSNGQCPNCMCDTCNITPRSHKITYCQYCGQAIIWW